MTTTINLGLPNIEAGQAQKHVTHNEALRILDALVMLAVEDRDLSAPPASPAEGDRYIVKAPGAGAFAGKDDQVAHFSDGGWSFHAPRAGWIAYMTDENTLLAWNGSAWVAALDALGVSALQNLSLLGVGTAADATNPLSAKLNNALMTAKSVAEGGDGDLRHKLNKEAAANTGSTLYQTGFSGRAEIGLAGDDDLHVKVSPDGVTWYEGLRIDRLSGRVSFPAGGPRELLTADRTYYVRTDGSDANSGLANSAAGAFLTIQKALDVVYGTLDLGGFNVTIQVGAGTYTGANSVTAPQVGKGAITVQGDVATPGNVVVDTTSANCFDVSNYAVLYLSGLKFQTSVSGHALNVSLGGVIRLSGKCEFGALGTGGAHMLATSDGTIVVSVAYLVTGGGAAHYQTSETGKIFAGGIGTITHTGTFSFASSYVRQLRLGYLQAQSNTYDVSGATVSGKRYDVQSNSVARTGGGGANYFPGDVAGTTATGGVYE